MENIVENTNIEAVPSPVLAIETAPSEVISDEQEYTSVPKMDFELVDEVFGSLNFVFHPTGFENGEEIDPRMPALFNVFLSMVGWTEDEFWTVNEEVNEMTAEEKHEEITAEVFSAIDAAIEEMKNVSKEEQTN